MLFQAFIQAINSFIITQMTKMNNNRKMNCKIVKITITYQQRQMLIIWSHLELRNNKAKSNNILKNIKYSRMLDLL